MGEPEELKMLSERHVKEGDMVKSVAIVGGTHGDELNGAHLVELFSRTPGSVHRKSFKTEVVLSNPEAFAEYRRYIDEDINRCFLIDRLKAENDEDTIEMKRAREIDKKLGPKSSPTPSCDFLFDLHNTTASTNVLLLMAHNDHLAHELAAHLLTAQFSTAPVELRICEWAPNEEVPFTPSVARSGMTVEVGPVPNGTLRASLFLQARKLILDSLDYLEQRNRLLEECTGTKRKRREKVTITVYQKVASVSLPQDSMGEIRGMIHPDLEGADFEQLKIGAPAFEMFDGSTRHLHRSDLCWNEKVEVGEDEPLFGFFINEAAYTKKGIAFCVAKAREVEVEVFNSEDFAILSPVMRGMNPPTSL